MKDIKKPSTEGLKKAQEEFKKTCEKPFTEELIKIISEVGEEDNIPENQDANQKVATNMDDTCVQLGS